MNEEIKEELKLCINCAYLIGTRHYLDNASEWICGAKENEKGINLVTGQKEYKVPLCTDQRSIGNQAWLCRSEGNWYEEYRKPEHFEQDPVLDLITQRHNRKKLTENDLENL